MEDNSGLGEIFTAYGKASSAFSSTIGSPPIFALIRKTVQNGILPLARQPITAKDIAEFLQLDQASVNNICLALSAHGVFRQENGFYCLEEDWMILTDPNIPFLLTDTIESLFVQAQVLDHLIESDYWQATPEVRRALARGVTLNPASPHAPTIIRTLIEEASTELHELLLAGAKYLELGCGVAGGLLSLLQAYPRVTAIAVDLAPDLLEEAYNQARLLHVADRVHFIHDDARNVTEQGSFDLVFWSQLFFPESTRVDALKVALHALKPGGFFMAPLLEEPPTTLEELRTEQGKQFTINRPMYGRWGIPAIGGQTLQSEVENIGFVNAQVVLTPISRVVMARRK